MELKHSGVGITSFIISLLVAIGAFFLVVVAGIIETTTPGGMDENSVAAVVVGLFIFACIFLQIVALGLGIGGLIQKYRKKIFAILGTAFSGMTILGIVFLMLVGSTM
ncbi:MAG: hypothetical protein JRF72_08550 [Deltaproteobacteria bacterium]|jgi:hypothetical protein|nr:hypothetical protein [Deltaproteobacteria bacterium]